jgi:hypothetical protein
LQPAHKLVRSEVDEKEHWVHIVLSWAINM